MAGFWPTPAAKAAFPVVADKMNSGPKVVFSRKLDRAAWSNTRLIKGDLAAEVSRLKQEPGAGITILGSGSIVAQLAPTGLIDEYQLVLIPIALGAGRTLFEGLSSPLNLKPIRPPRSFANGNVVLCYTPA
jgi:dihydrofolate reductase